MTKRKPKELDPREAQRIRTTKRNKGPNFFHENAIKAGKQTPTKFTSESGSRAANIRWDRWRAEQAAKAQKKAAKLKEGQNNG